MSLNIKYSSFKDKIPRVLTSRQLWFDHFIGVQQIIQNSFICSKYIWMVDLDALPKIQSQVFKLHFDPLLCTHQSVATAGYNRRTDLMINELVIYQKINA